MNRQNDQTSSKVPKIACVWPTGAARGDIHYVPITSIRKFFPTDCNNFDRDALYKFKKENATLFTVCHILGLGDSKDQMFHGKRIIYPNRIRNFGRTIPSSSEEEKSTKRKEKALTKLKRRDATQEASLKTLQQYRNNVDSLISQSTLSSAKSTANVNGPCLSNSTVSFKDGLRLDKTAIPDSQSQDYRNFGSLDDDTATPSSQSQDCGAFGMLENEMDMRHSQEFRSQEEPSQPTIEKALLELRHLQSEVEANALRAEQERKGAEAERKRAELLLQRATEAQQKTEDNIQTLETMKEMFLKEKETFFKEHQEMIQDIERKMKEYAASMSSASSVSSVSSNSSKSSTSSSSKDIEENSPMDKTMINIGKNVMVNAHYWSMCCGARSIGNWAKYALKAAFGEDSKYYRVSTPRLEDPQLKMIPDNPPYMTVFQYHYRKFLLDNPSLIRMPGRKNNKKPTDDVEGTLRFLVTGLGARLADQATSMYTRKDKAKIRKEKSAQRRTSKTVEGGSPSCSKSAEQGISNPNENSNQLEEGGTDTEMEVASRSSSHLYTRSSIIPKEVADLSFGKAFAPITASTQRNRLSSESSSDSDGRLSPQSARLHNRWADNDSLSDPDNDLVEQNKIDLSGSDTTFNGE